MGSTKLTYHKERSFASNHFPFAKILFQFRNLVYRVHLMSQPPKCPYPYSPKALEFYFRVISQIYNENTKRPKRKENQLGTLGSSSREFTHYVGRSAEGIRSRRECCWGYVSIFENFCLIYQCV